MTDKIYTVQAGDTLSKIAERLYGDVDRWHEIAYINSLAYPYIIKPGQVLRVSDPDHPLVIEITKKVTPHAATPTPGVGFTLSPATALKALAVGVALYLVFSS